MGEHTMEEEPSTDSEKLIERWFHDLFNRGDLDVADEILAADVSYHGPQSLTPQDVTGPADIKEYVSTYQEAFPDLEYTVERVVRADGELYVWWTVSGTHESDLFEIESTGETFTEDGVNCFVVEDDRITEIRSEWDTLEMAQELGVVPPVGKALD